MDKDVILQGIKEALVVDKMKQQIQTAHSRTMSTRGQKQNAVDIRGKNIVKPLNIFSL